VPKVEVNLDQLANALEELSPGELETLEIRFNPELRAELKDRWAEFGGLWSYHVSYHGGEYRIVYEIYPQDGIVLVIMIGSREGFYKALRRRVKG